MRTLVCLSLAFLAPILAPAQGHPYTVTPGLTITNGSTPWALDQFENQPQLVPIHHSTVEVNNHRGANLAGSAAGSFFYKPKMTMELAGLNARSVVHTATPVFYLYKPKDPDSPSDTDQSMSATWAISRAVLTKDHRVFAKIQFTQLTGNAHRNDGLVEAKIEDLGDGWTRITPTSPLEPGQYAIMPVFKVQNVFSSVIFDLEVDPRAPNDPDAVSPKS